MADFSGTRGMERGSSCVTAGGTDQTAVSPVYNVVQFGYRLSIMPDSIQGRVNSVFRLIALSFNPLGAGLSGVLLQVTGGVVTVLLLCLWITVLAVAAFITPAIRHAPRLVHVE